MPNYEKDLENQNYDLMVRLAGLQQLVDDFRTIKGANEKFLLSIISENLAKIYELSTYSLLLKKILLENGIEEDQINPLDATLHMNILDSNDIVLLRKSTETHIEDAIKYSDSNSFDSHLSSVIINKHIIPCLKSLELDGEDDESI